MRLLKARIKTQPEQLQPDSTTTARLTNFTRMSKSNKK